MNVLDHEPAAWFLLEDGDRLLFDVNCSHSFFGYSVLIALDEGEMEQFRARGRAFLHVLAADVNNAAIVVAATHSPYEPRDLTATLGQQVNTAVDAWRDESQDAGR